MHIYTCTQMHTCIYIHMYIYTCEDSLQLLVNESLTIVIIRKRNSSTPLLLLFIFWILLSMKATSLPVHDDVGKRLGDDDDGV
jgi:hypothetical protein